MHLVFALLLVLHLCSAQIETSPDGSQCQDMERECNSCVCCCYRSGLDVMKYKPNSDCLCESEIAKGFVASMIILGVSLVTSIVGGCYFSGKLPITPFKPPATLPAVELTNRPR